MPRLDAAEQRHRGDGRLCEELSVEGSESCREKEREGFVERGGRCSGCKRKHISDLTEFLKYAINTLIFYEYFVL